MAWQHRGMTDFIPGAPIPVPEVPNLRDLGGWTTASGRTVTRGVLYRSTALGSASGSGVERLGLGTVIDLRTAPERESAPDAPIAPIVVADVLADSPTAAGASTGLVSDLLKNPSALVEALSAYAGTAADAMIATYRDFIELPSANAAYATLLRTIADADAPVLFHCTTGKDRTGWGAAVVLSLLGVDADDVMGEDLLTNEQLLPSFQPLIDGFVAEGGDPEALTSVLGVHSSYLITAFDTMGDRYGDLETYVRDGLGVSDADVARIRERLLS